MQIHQREREGIVILDLDGALVLDAPQPRLRETLHHLLEAGQLNIALNMERVKRIDSTGLGTLVFAHVKLKKAGGRLALFHLNALHLNLLLLTKLVTVFELFVDEQNAVNSFFADRDAQPYDILRFAQQQQTERPLPLES